MFLNEVNRQRMKKEFFCLCWRKKPFICFHVYCQTSLEVTFGFASSLSAAWLALIAFSSAWKTAVWWPSWLLYCRFLPVQYTPAPVPAWLWPACVYFAYTKKGIYNNYLEIVYHSLTLFFLLKCKNYLIIVFRLSEK